MAKLFDVDKDELLRLLGLWRHLGFNIDGNEIMVDDMSAFIENIDAQFAAWHGMEESKAGKLGDTPVGVALDTRLVPKDWNEREQIVGVGGQPVDIPPRDNRKAEITHLS